MTRTRLFALLLVSIALVAPSLAEASQAAATSLEINHRTGYDAWHARRGRDARTRLAVRHSQPAQFTIIDAPGAQRTYVVAVNSSSVSSGFFFDGNGDSHGFLRAPDGTFTIFDAEGPHGQTQSWWMNDEGEVTGTCLDPNSGALIGFKRSPAGKIATFTGSAGGSGVLAVYSLNRFGEIVGDSYDSSKVEHAFFRLKNGTTVQFDAPGAKSGATTAFDINTPGTITGPFADSTGYHSYLRFADGTFTVFDVPGASETEAIGINKFNWVTGTYSDSSGVTHGFVRDAQGNITTFDAPDVGPRGPTWPIELNSHGQVTGHFADANDVIHGFVRARSGSVVEFDAPSSGSTSTVATIPYDINQYGVIAGWDQDDSGAVHGFLRTPNEAQRWQARRRGIRAHGIGASPP